MSFYKFISFLLLFFISFTHTTYAKLLDTSFFPPALKNLIAVAIENNKDLQAAKHNVQLAKAKMTQAGALPNPSLEFTYANDRVFNNDGEYASRVGISQDFPIGGRIAKQTAVARVDIAIAETEILEAERKLRSQVAENYFSLLITFQRLTQINHLIASTQTLTHAASERFRLGEVSEIDSNTAQLEYQRLQQEKEVLNSQQTAKMIQLNVLLGRPQNTPNFMRKSMGEAYIVAETFPLLNSLPSLPQLQAIAIQQRPDFIATWLNLNRAQADMALARSQRWADWKVGLGVDQGKRVIQGAPPQDTDRLLAFNLSIPVPLLNQNRGRVEEASNAQAKAQATIQALRLTIEAEVASNYHQVHSLQQVLKRTKSNFLPLSNKNVTLAQRAYKSGQISLFEVLQVQRQQNDLYLTYLTTLEQYSQALTRLQTAIGKI